MTRVCIVAALGRNRVIGRGGGMPWHFSADLERFKRITMGYPVIMGRRTYESIGRPLPGRANVVVTRTPGYAAPGCTVALSLEAALAACHDADRVTVAGGAELYQAALPMTQTMYLTLIHHDFEGDTFFPAYDERAWRESAREDVPADVDAGAPYDHSFVTLEKN
ncbi:MAG: dihydrofolate reductase [Gammaproteobacteria bacterium]